MKFIDIRERIKFLKYGYGRATDQLNIEIRLGNISRKEALNHAKKIDGKISNDNLEEFSEFIGLSKKKVLRLINSYVNYDIFKQDDNGDFIEIYERY